jgi:hypothetical protein
MDSTPISLYEDIIINILMSYYNIREIDEEIIKFHIINLIKHFLFNFNDKKIGICIIQELDKINYNIVNFDVQGYKFYEKDRILVSQFANNINNLFLIKNDAPVYN